jgi:hypothetical protein
MIAFSQKMHYQNYDVSSKLGMTTNNINDLIIDESHFIWEATENGLYKFDEKLSIKIPGTKPNEKILKLSLFNNELYFLTSFKNIYIVQNNRAKIVYDRNNPLKNISFAKINKFIVSDKNAFFFAGEKIMHFKDGKTNYYQTLIYGPNHIGQNINGQWTNAGKLALDFGIIQNLAWFNEPHCFIEIVESDIGLFFLKKGKSNEVYQLTGKILKKHVLPQIVEYLTVDNNNQIWVSFVGNTLYKYDENFLTSHLQLNKVKGKLVLDQTGNIWFGSINKGLFKFFNTNIQIFSVNEAENLKNLYFLNNNKAYLETNDNAKQSFNLGSNTLNENETEYYELDKFLKLIILKNNKIEFKNYIKLFYKNNYLAIKTIQGINDQTFIISTSHKIYKYNLLSAELELIYKHKTIINDFLALNDDLIYMADQGQAYAFDIKEKKLKKILPNTAVNRIKKRGNILVFATEKKGLIFYDVNLNKIKDIEKILDNSGKIFPIKDIEIDQNRLFAITHNGLHEYSWFNNLNRKNFYNTTNGLPQNEVEDIQIFNNRIYGITKSHFFLFDLLNSSLDKDYVLNNPTIERIQFGDTILYDYNNIDIDFRIGIMQIKISSPFNSNNDRVKFHYKLNGFDKNWKTSPDGLIEYTNYPTGNQTLEYYASLDNGEKKSAIKALKFNISQPFWFSDWFRWSIFLLLFILILDAFTFSFYVKTKELERDKEIVEFQQKALRAQINPHFLFNALNSIQNFAFKNDVVQLSNYIEKFATLTRSILKHSENEFITLKQEIDVLKNYMDIEKLRFQNFNYSLLVDPVIDDEMIFVPSLLLQPIVENAIWHGFQNSPKFGELNLNFSIKDNLLKIEIEDNGVGRNFKTRKNHESKGMSLIESRLKLLNDPKAQLRIIDKTKANENLGTIVEIFMPILNIENTKKIKKPLHIVMYGMIKDFLNKFNR